MLVALIEINLTDSPEDRHPVAVRWQDCAYRFIFRHPALVFLHPGMEPISID